MQQKEEEGRRKAKGEIPRDKEVKAESRPGPKARIGEDRRVKRLGKRGSDLSVREFCAGKKGMEQRSARPLTIRVLSHNPDGGGNLIHTGRKRGGNVAPQGAQILPRGEEAFLTGVARTGLSNGRE